MDVAHYSQLYYLALTQRYRMKTSRLVHLLCHIWECQLRDSSILETGELQLLSYAYKNTH